MCDRNKYTANLYPPQKHITLQDIKLLSGNAKATTYQLTEELKTGHYAKIFNTTNTLMSNQEDPLD